MPSLDFAERLGDLAPGAYPDGLRPAQTHVLDRFAESHTRSSDVGIELPTGEGKTLIGLLIAD
jgi:superfamily II DNA or RNA helicase